MHSQCSPLCLFWHLGSWALLKATTIPHRVLHCKFRLPACAGPSLVSAHLKMLSSLLLHHQFLIYTRFLKHSPFIIILYPCIWKSCDHQTLSSLIWGAIWKTSLIFMFILKCLSSARDKVLIVLFKSILLCWWPHLLPAPLGYCFISHFLSLVFSTFPSLQPPLLSLNIYSYLPFLGKTVSSLKPVCCFCYQFVSTFQSIFFKSSLQSFYLFPHL